MVWYLDAGSNGRRVYVPFCPALAEGCYCNRRSADRCLDDIFGVVDGPRPPRGDVGCTRGFELFGAPDLHTSQSTASADGTSAVTMRIRIRLIERCPNTNCTLAVTNLTNEIQRSAQLSAMFLSLLSESDPKGIDDCFSF